MNTELTVQSSSRSCSSRASSVAAAFGWPTRAARLIHTARAEPQPELHRLRVPRADKRSQRPPNNQDSTFLQSQGQEKREHHRRTPKRGHTQTPQVKAQPSSLWAPLSTHPPPPRSSLCPECAHLHPQTGCLPGAGPAPCPEASPTQGAVRAGGAVPGCLQESCPPPPTCLPSGRALSQGRAGVDGGEPAQHRDCRPTHLANTAMFKGVSLGDGHGLRPRSPSVTTALCFVRLPRPLWTGQCVLCSSRVRRHARRTFQGHCGVETLTSAHRGSCCVARSSESLSRWESLSAPTCLCLKTQPREVGASRAGL